MSRLQELIQKLCPDGVEYKALEEIGAFFGGLTGKSKDDFKDGNAKFITYRNVYSNPSLNLDIKDKVKIADNEKQHVIRYGDILFTGSSETPDECGMSSVVATPTNEKLYLNSFCFGLRLYDMTAFDIHYLKHILRSSDIREQIRKTASGVTRYNVSKKRFAKIYIPIPPIEVQTEISRILDAFTFYAAELQAELQARKEQYAYYRDQLLTFDEHAEGVEWKKLGEIGTFTRGNGLQKKDFTDVGIGCIHYGQIYTYYGTSASQIKTHVNSELARKLAKVNTGNLVIACTSENIDDVCKAVVWLGNEEIVTGGHACVFSHNEEPKYIAYFFQTSSFDQQKKKYARGTKVIDIKTSDLEKILIPIPSLSEQQRIVSILDKFEALVNDLTVGLPAEIAAVQEQYEYYRNKLLSFPRK